MSAIKPCKPDSNVYYFAYGANLSSKTLSRRNIGQITTSIPCQVKDPNVALAFCHRNAYATLISKEGIVSSRWVQLKDDKNRAVQTQNQLFYYEKPHGVVYSITSQQLDKLKQSEIGYDMKTIDVIPYDQNRPPIKSAIVFLSSPLMLLQSPAKPSERYRKLLLDGAIEHSLNEEYIAWIKSIPTVPASDISSMSQPEYSNTLLEMCMKSFLLMVFIGSLSYYF